MGYQGLWVVPEVIVGSSQRLVKCPYNVLIYNYLNPGGSESKKLVRIVDQRELETSKHIWQPKLVRMTSNLCAKGQQCTSKRSRQQQVPAAKMV